MTSAAADFPACVASGDSAAVWSDDSPLCDTFLVESSSIGRRDETESSGVTCCPVRGCTRSLATGTVAAWEFTVAMSVMLP